MIGQSYYKLRHAAQSRHIPPAYAAAKHDRQHILLGSRLLAHCESPSEWTYSGTLAVAKDITMYHVALLNWAASLQLDMTLNIL